MTHYEVLGVDPTASTAEIRRVYLALARRHHPDRVASRPPAERAASAQRMQEINAAWGVLRDPGSRASYDRRIGVAPGSRDVFQPFDEGDDPDPRLAPDVPYAGARPVTGARRAVTLAPMVLVAAAIGIFSVGLVIGSIGLLLLSGILVAISVAGFVIGPLMVMSEARRRDR